MLKSILVRIGVLAFLALVGVTVLHSPSSAQTAPVIPPEKAQRFLELLNDPEVKAWLESKTPATVEEAPAGSFADSITSWEAAVHDRLAGLLDAIPRIPAELSTAADVAARNVNSGRPGLVVGIVAVLVVIGFGAEWLVRRGLGRRRSGSDGGQAAMTETAALVTFALASVGSFLVFECPPLLRKIVLTLLLAVIIVRAVRAVARWLLAFGGALGNPPDPVVEASHAAASYDAQGFWLRRVSLIAGLFFFGWATVSFVPELSFSTDMVRLVALLLGLGLLAVGIDIVWRQPSKPVIITQRLAEASQAQRVRQPANRSRRTGESARSTRRE
jgi:hypothetical protein